MIKFRWLADDGSALLLNVDDFRIGPSHRIAGDVVFKDFLHRHGLSLEGTVEITFGFTHMVVVEYHKSSDRPRPHLSHECRGNPAGEEVWVCLEVRAVPYLPGLLHRE